MELPARCQNCGKEVSEGDLYSHLLRKGYSLAEFPFLTYKRAYLCFSCLEDQRRKELWEKVLAIIALGMFFSLLVFGYLALFGVFDVS